MYLGYVFLGRLWLTVRLLSIHPTVCNVCFACRNITLLIGWILTKLATNILAHWAELDYGLSAGQHAILPEGKGKATNIHYVNEHIAEKVFKVRD